MSMLPTSLFLALNVAWLALELWLGLRRKSGGYGPSTRWTAFSPWTCTSTTGTN